MRTSTLAAALIAGFLAATTSLYAGEGCAAAPACGCNAGDGGCFGDPCDPCGRHCGCGLLGHHCGCGLFGHKCGSGIDGLDRYANCACNGSYNYPVPPLYTYHWPGMYKQVRMTDYHSPWRFPPLKRYEDEPLPTIETPATGSASGPRLLRPVSLQEARAATYHTQIEPLSSRLSR